MVRSVPSNDKGPHRGEAQSDEASYQLPRLLTPSPERTCYSYPWSKRLSGTTVPSALRHVLRIAADRSVSTTTVRFVQGVAPEIEQKLSVGERTEAHISRDQISEHTGLSSSSVLPEYYPRQADEVGVIRRVRKGRFGLVELAKNVWRGEATSWTLDWDAYTPKDIPVLALETEDFWVDVDREAVLAALAPTASTWARQAEAHRFVLALIHHAGLRRVKVDAKVVTEVLGTSRSTAYRLLKRLEELGLLADGWMDIQHLVMDASAVQADPEHAESVRLAKVRRWSVFTREGWEVQGYARQALAFRQTVAEDDVRPEFWGRLGGGLTKAVDYLREVLSAPDATGRGVTAADF